jgi:hypothetical protein
MQNIINIIAENLAFLSSRLPKFFRIVRMASKTIASSRLFSSIR